MEFLNRFSGEVSNRKKDKIKIISMNRKTETQLQQTAALRFSSSISVSTGKSNWFSKFYYINRALEANIPRLVFSRFFNIRENLGNIKEKC